MNQFLGGGYGALLALLCAAAPLRAQTLDSTRTDSTAQTVYSKTSNHFYTTTVTVTAPLPSGIDTAPAGDTTRFARWYTGKVIDSTWFTVAAPVVLGQPWGPTAYLNETSSGIFTFAPNESSNKAKFLLDNIAEARARKISVRLALPCGSHSQTSPGNCLAPNASGRLAFSRARFDSAFKAIATPEVRSAVVQAYRDGVVSGLMIVDEPWVSGTDDGAGAIVGNTWGPKGTLLRVTVDSLCALSHALYPGVPVGVSDHFEWDTTGSLKVCDFGVAQYVARFGSMTAWRDAALARAARQGYQMGFSFNLLNGGIQDRDGVWDCSKEGGIKGQSSPNCQMTPALMIEAVTVLGGESRGGLMMWTHDATRFLAPGYAKAFATGLAVQATRPRRLLTPR